MKIAIRIAHEQEQRQAGGDRVVVAVDEPALDHVADHLRLGIAQQFRVHVVADRRDERQDRAREHAGQAEGKDHPDERLGDQVRPDQPADDRPDDGRRQHPEEPGGSEPEVAEDRQAHHREQRAGRGSNERAAPSPRPRVQVLGRLDEPQVDLLDRNVERQHHERQELVRQAGHDSQRRVDDREVVRDQVERVQRPDDRPRVREDDPPRDRPDQEVGEERGDDEEQQDRLVAPAAEGDAVGEGIADQERQERGHPAVQERVAVVVVEPLVGRQVDVVAEVPGEPEALLERALGQGHHDHLDVRQHEEHGEPQEARGHQEPGQQPPPAAHARRPRRVSSVGRAAQVPARSEYRSLTSVSAASSQVGA